MISIKLPWRSLFGGSRRRALLINSSRSLSVRNRNSFPWHLTLTQSCLSLFRSDNKFKLSSDSTGLNNMSTFTYPVAKRIDFSENLHGITVKRRNTSSFTQNLICAPHTIKVKTLHLMLFVTLTRWKTPIAGWRIQILLKHRSLFVFRMNLRLPTFRAVQLWPVSKKDWQSYGIFLNIPVQWKRGTAISFTKILVSKIIG